MLKKGKGFEIDWVELPIVLMLATDLDLVEVSMNFSHMDHEYEKIRRRMNPPRDCSLTAVQLFWVNMIMDTLGALALATEPPNNDLMKCPPVGERQNYISNAMWRNMLEQSFYQFTVIWLLKAIGQAIFHLDEPDSHVILSTLIFNTSVFCQVFDKKIWREMVEMDVFKGILDNPIMF